jgi:tetratricopeptide (TPR) repeat protein
MRSKGRQERRTSDDLKAGAQLAGLELCELISRDAFCSLWLADPVVEDRRPACLRVIPTTNLLIDDGARRLLAELLFWQDLPDTCAVSLYDCGRDGPYCFLAMRHMTGGSLAHRLAGGGFAADEVAEFAVALARSLRDLHGAMGAHGNLKPSNIFPLPSGDVLLSDFSIPLWADEFDEDPVGLAGRLMHPYRAPEQRADLRDCDTRSDIYSYGLVLYHCLTGQEPDPEGELPALDFDECPPLLADALRRCLMPDRDARFGDAYEMVAMLEEALAEAAEPPSDEGDDFISQVELAGPDDVPGRVENARGYMEEGLLDEAVDVLEALPPETEGMAELLDEIEKRHQACEELTQEAVRLAGSGRPVAARETIEEAERLWRRSRTVIAVKAELAAEAGQDPELLSSDVPEPLRQALGAGRYLAARSQLEKLIRKGHTSEDVLRVVRRFKRERARKAFLDSINKARRLYVLGHQQEAKEQWLEAANWLPGGPHRARLRMIAGAAGRGKLRLNADELGLNDTAARTSLRVVAEEAARSGPQTAEDWARLRRKWLWVAGICLAVSTLLIILWAVITSK